MRLFIVVALIACTALTGCGASKPPLPSGQRVSITEFAAQRSQANANRIRHAQYVTNNKKTTEQKRIADTEADSTTRNFRFESEGKE